MTMSWTLFWTTLGLAGLAYWARLCRPIFISLMHPRELSRVRLDPRGLIPADVQRDPVASRVSVIVPACNEEAAIGRCLESLTRQTGINLQIVAVNDRSSDATGKIIDEWAAGDDRIIPIHVAQLPAGWLGKNHANHLGASAATGEWVVFTDGDIVFAPDAIARALAHAEAENVDHLCVLPGLDHGGFWEQAACAFFVVLFAAHVRPWSVRNPLVPGSFCGVGAFNLVRRSAYDAIGGHRPLCLEVVDDVKLGKLLKRTGFVTDVIFGGPLVRVRWQIGLSGVILGLEKNGFAGAEYRLAQALAGVASIAGLVTLPLMGILMAPAWTKLIFLIWLAAQMALLSLAATRIGQRWWIGLGLPVVGIALAWAILRSMLLAYRRGGVRWRGTLYHLDELRKGVV